MTAPVAERDILAAVLIAVTALPGGMFIRQNTGVAVTVEGRRIRFGRPGQADIIGCYRGRFVAIECKTARGRLSDAQVDYGIAVRGTGGTYIVARSAQDALDGLACLI